MTTLVINDNTMTARHFLAYVKTLPFVSIQKEKANTKATLEPPYFKCSVAKSLLQPRKQKEINTYSNADEMFNSLEI
jgi:hypothetical protein